MPKKILIVEDDATSIRLLQSRLEQQGYDVILARDGDVGLEKAAKERPDVIIMDVEMPRMNGYMFLSEMAKDPGIASTPIIALTSHEDMQAIFERKGVVAYFIKPVDFMALLAKLESV